MLEKIDSTILTIGPPGSQRTISVWIKKGDLILNGTNNNILFEMESKNYFSEANKSVMIGRINTSTIKKNEINMVKLKLNYSTNYNLTINGADKVTTLNKAPTPYEFLIVNKGDDGNGKVQIDILID